MDFDNKEEEEPTIEDIKKIVDSKRVKNSNQNYSKEQKLKNLELAREKKRYLNEIKKNQITPAPIQQPIPAPTPAPIPTPTTDNNLIIELKNMILKQNEMLENIKIEPKKKIKKEPKKKQVIRSLDLTITDKEINNIIIIKKKKKLKILN